MRGGDVSAEPTGSIVPGAILAGVWLVAALGSRRLGDKRLTALHAVVAVTAVVGLYSMSRIVGFVWYWVALWGWGIAAAMLLATGWTAGLAVARRLPPARRRGRARGAALIAGASALLLASGVSAADLSSVEVVTPPSAVIGELLPDVERALDPDNRYLVVWDDPVNLGVHGYSLVNELERRGFDVGSLEEFEPPLGEHRVIDPDDATAVVHLAGGVQIDVVAQQPGAERIAYADVRTEAERAEYDRVRAELIMRLTTTGHEDLVPNVDHAIWSILQNTDLGSRTTGLAERMINISVPYAVIVVPADPDEPLSQA
jgi:hypothetical protein